VRTTRFGRTLVRERGVTDEGGVRALCDDVDDLANLLRRVFTLHTLHEFLPERLAKDVAEFLAEDHEDACEAPTGPPVSAR
jgi:hypothetical protein